jgi:hypothetical protein
MIYLIGGAPRVGKSILCQQFSAKLRIGWISTDSLLDLLRFRGQKGVKTEWNAAPESITAGAEWFFPYLERFVWGVNSMTESYAIEGVDFLPAQVQQISSGHQIRAVFLGRSQMTLETFDQFPGRSLGYVGLPEVLRRQMAQDVPRWSEFLRKEAGRFGYAFIDMADNFPRRLAEAESALINGIEGIS